jgi:ATP-binding cassette, subfamily C, bacteriocin exporter
MKKGIKIKQHDITDCGAACIASVSAHYGLKLPIAKIRQLASTDKKGTNVLGMIEASEKLGYQAKGVRGTFDSLPKIPKPAIAHVIIKEALHHFVVIYDYDEQYVTIMDPGDGEFHKKTHEEFKKEWSGVLILLLPDENNFKPGNEKISNIQRFWYLISPHKTVMFQALFGAALYTILGLSTSIYIQKITDHVLIEGNKNLLNLLSISMILLLLFQMFIGSTKTLFALKTGQKIDAQLILGYYKHLMKLPQQFFDTMRVGEILSRVNDAVKIRLFINDVAFNLIVNIFIVVFSFCLMFTYYWKLAMLMLAVIPMYSLVYFITNKINKKQQRKLMEKSADLETQLVESLSNVTTIKRFGIETFSNIRTETRFIELLKTIYSAGVNGLYTGNASELISRLLTIILLWSGSLLVIDNELTPGELLSFYSLIGYFTGPASSLITMNKTVQDALIAADRLFEIMDLDREEVENKFIMEKEMVGDITFKNVFFRYGSRSNVFNGLDLDITKGNITAIVGESGSGKSTLMSLLQNLYKLQDGAIKIGGIDINHIQNENLRQLVSVVPQQTDLFAGNIIDNIALGDYEPDMQRIVGICKMLGITEFVEKLPEGFGTYVGENGANLSGGQKQRIAIARALYRKPEIIILDEATASLDAHSENYVQQTIQALRKSNKTIIIIAHRLITVKNADKIMVLKDGKLVEEGTHTELIRKVGGNYNKLWRLQFDIDENGSPYSMVA